MRIIYGVKSLENNPMIEAKVNPKPMFNLLTNWDWIPIAFWVLLYMICATTAIFLLTGGLK
jgi:hypothetical protein